MHALPLIAAGLLTSLAFGLQAQTHHDHAHHGHDHEQHQDAHNAAQAYGSNPGAHLHGVARLDLVLDANLLAVELHSPADNILGFEYLPVSATDRATTRAAMDTLHQADSVVSLPAAAGCSLDRVTLDSPIFAALGQASGHELHGDKAHSHNDISARYAFTCRQPAALDVIEVSLFAHFPRTGTVILQAITPNAQQGGELTAGNNSIRL